MLAVFMWYNTTKQ